MRKKLKKKNIKNLILSIICIFVLQGLAISAPATTQIPVSSSYDDMVSVAREQVSASPASGDVQVQTKLQEEPLAPRGDLAYSNAMPEAQVANTTAIQPQVQTKTKPRKSFASMVFKFILAMIWVVISSIVIFIILISYKKLILKGKPVRPTYETTEQSLDTPKNFKEAIKLFLDKTKW